jgi:hypothetical protein
VSGGDPAVELGRLRAELQRARKTIAELRKAMGYQRREIAALREQSRDPHSIRKDDLPDNAIVCEAHLWLVWPHHDCAGPGMAVEERATLHETAGLIPNADLEASCACCSPCGRATSAPPRPRCSRSDTTCRSHRSTDRENDASPRLGCRPPT